MTQSSSRRRFGKSRRKNSGDGEMTLRDHLKELRNRASIALVALALGAGSGFFLYQPAFTILVEPVSRLSTEDHPAEVVFSSVAQPFDIMLQVAIFLGLLLSSPVWLYQLWAFIMPGLRKNEKRYALAFLAAAVPLFIGGVVLGWWALPQAIQFFIGLAPEGTANRIMATVYVPFVLRLMLAFGLALVLPVVLVGLNLAGLLKGRQILRHWRISVFVIALISAMAAPGADVMTMFYLGAPLVVLFGIALGLSLINDRLRDKRLARKDAIVEEEIRSGAAPVNNL